MSKLTILAVAILIVGAGAALGQSDSTKRREGSITGRIVNEAGQPIPNAGVYLRKSGVSSGLNRTITTDEDGRFKADDLTPGAYTITAAVPGYVPEIDPVQREYHRIGESVDLRMIKGGVITGAVTASSAETLAGVRVHAIRVRDTEGRPIRGVEQSGTSRQTDDRGIYRLYGLQPGSYVIAVNDGGQNSYPASPFVGDAPTYYPSTTRDAAEEVAVRAGQEVTGIDIRYRGDRGYSVSGTLSGSLGSESAQRGVFLALVRASSGSVQSNNYIQLRQGRGFALYGVPDGEYELTAQLTVGLESNMSSGSRRVVVKGADVTGIDLALIPLASIGGHVVLERMSEADRKDACKSKSTSFLDDLVVVARRDEKSAGKEQPGFGPPILNEGSPDEKGEFKIPITLAARYRLENRLPSDDWFVRSIVQGATTRSKQPKDVAGPGISVAISQRISDLVVTIAEGAAALRGKVVVTTQGASLPAHIRVHLVPAEPESLDDAVRFAEATLDSEGSFSLSNIAPGRYYAFARKVSGDQAMERTPEPLAWDAAARIKLRRDAQATDLEVELQRCQRVTDFVIKYTPDTAKRAGPRRKP